MPICLLRKIRTVVKENVETSYFYKNQMMNLISTLNNLKEEWYGTEHSIEIDVFGEREDVVDKDHTSYNKS